MKLLFVHNFCGIEKQKETNGSHDKSQHGGQNTKQTT